VAVDFRRSGFDARGAEKGVARLGSQERYAGKHYMSNAGYILHRGKAALNEINIRSEWRISINAPPFVHV
jgi:hypothetical protein